MRTPEAHPRAHLAGFAEGSLSTSATASVALHLEDCETCHLEVERWERLFAAFQRLPAPAVPAGLSDRILFSVARERARQSRVASWLGRAAAALSWGYAAGGAVFSALALVVAIVPAWREAAARGLGFASGEALRFGLGTLDATSGTLGLIRDGVGDVLNRTEWISVLGRAFAAAASQPEAQLVLAAGGSATLLLLLVLLAGRPGRRDRLEAPHAGFLVA